MKSAGVLLVEGKSDEEFYNAICERYDFKARVKVAPPRPLGGQFNNKEGLFSVLPLQLAQLADASLERLAIVVDADFPATHGLGFARTYDRVKTIVSEYGFNPVKRNGIDGLLFASSEGFHDIGLWIMPNNKNDGMLEDLVKLAVDPSEHKLFSLAANTVAKIPAPKFKHQHISKAEVATWLAWQEAPGRGMEHAIKAELIDKENSDYKKMITWLNHVFG